MALRQSESSFGRNVLQKPRPVDGEHHLT